MGIRFLHVYIGKGISQPCWKGWSYDKVGCHRKLDQVISPSVHQLYKLREAACRLCRSEVCSGEAKQMLWYAMVVSHPPEVRQYLKHSSSTLLVAEMATCDLSIESAVLMLRTLRHEERELFKYNVVPQIMSDKR